MDRVKKLAQTLHMLVASEFTGYVKINFSQGSIGRVEKFEEFRDAANICMAYRSGGKKETELHEN